MQNIFWALPEQPCSFLYLEIPQGSSLSMQTADSGRTNRFLFVSKSQQNQRQWIGKHCRTSEPVFRSVWYLSSLPPGWIWHEVILLLKATHKSMLIRGRNKNTWTGRYFSILGATTAKQWNQTCQVGIV